MHVRHLSISLFILFKFLESNNFNLFLLHQCLACTGEHSHDNVPSKVGLSSPVKKIVQLGVSFNQHKAQAILAKLRRDNEDATKRGDSDALISLPKVIKLVPIILCYLCLLIYSYTYSPFHLLEKTDLQLRST